MSKYIIDRSAKINRLFHSLQVFFRLSFFEWFFSVVFNQLSIFCTSAAAKRKNSFRQRRFGKGGSAADKEMMGEGMLRGSQTINDNTGTGITNYGIGEEEAPLGSGLLVLIGAGLGYVALKKKED